MEIGIIGAGWWAAQAYIPALQKNKKISAVSVCRRGAEGLETLKAEFGLEHGFTDAQELLDQRKLSGVIVSSPHVVHAEHTLMCIARKLPVMIEKPMTSNVADARQVAKAATENQTPAIIAYGWNFRPVAAAARKLIDEGWIGDLVHATCITATATQDLFSGRAPEPTKAHLFQPAASTWSDPARAGGYAWGQLTHALGMFFLLVEQSPRRVFTQMGFSEVGVDLSEAAVMELESGATVAVSGTACLPRGMKKQVDIRLYGTKGILLVDVERERVEATRFDGTRQVVDLAEGDGAYGIEELLAKFVDLCAGDPITNYADQYVGMRAVEAIDCMYRSAKSGKFENV